MWTSPSRQLGRYNYLCQSIDSPTGSLEAQTRLMMIRQDITPKYSLHNKMTDLLIYKAKLANSLPLTRLRPHAPTRSVANTWHLWPSLYPQPEEKMRPQFKKQELRNPSLLPGLVRGKQFPRYTLAPP